MSKKKIWSGVLPLSILVVFIGGIFLLGQIAARQDKVIDAIGSDGVGITLDEGGKRIIQIKYSVNGHTFIKGAGKPFDYLQPNEHFKIKYLPEDPESMVVFFDEPFFSSELEYLETKCKAINKTLSVVSFEYVVNGQIVRRETLFRNHKLSPTFYKVIYRENNPLIGYLVAE